FIACDIVVGESSMFADYIVPDLTYLERWGTPHVSPDIPTKTSKVRQPVAQPLTEEVTIDGETMPISLEAFLIAVAKRLELPGFGTNGLGAEWNLDRPEDWYLKLVANLACGDSLGEAVPDATDREMTQFRAARRHLPPSVFDEARWQAALRPEDWRKVVYVLNRGGRFASFEEAYDGHYMKKRMGKMFHIFMERVASQRNSMSGELFPGMPVYRGQFDARGESLDQGGAYPLTLITYKEPFAGHSRTISNYWSNVALQPENYLHVNLVTARDLGLRDGERVRLVSAANPNGTVELGERTIDVAGPLKVEEGIRPGVVAVSWHYGHWAYGSSDVEIDGETIAGDSRRAAGLCPNPIMAVDPVIGDVCLTDPVGGSSSFLDTRVNLVLTT
ncbi:MAG: molybdopterin dinucleotide binding domain-containing protein, partial [Gemmatimonadales bacterium]